MNSAKLNGSAEINQSFENGDDEVAANSLEALLRRVSEVSTAEIENLIDEFHELRKKLQTDLSSIQHNIAEYRELSQAVMQLTVSISDGMKKLQAAQRLFDTRTG
jgi:methyl-accepting chemotaxis protein